MAILSTHINRRSNISLKISVINFDFISLPGKEHILFRLILVMIVTLLLAGCQSAANFERNMLTWRGQPIHTMIEQWGYPNGELTSPDGNKVYVYGNSGSVYVPQTTTYNTNANVIGNSVFSTTNAYSAGGYSINMNCTVYVEFGEDKVIKNVSWRGNHCVA